MAERLIRTNVADLTIRSDGRTIAGIAVPYGTATTITERGSRYEEIFRPGAFKRSIAERGSKVKLLAQHDRDAMPLGVATLLREEAAGLYGEFRVSATAKGDEILELVRDGAVDSFSVGFRPIRDNWTSNRTRVPSPGVDPSTPEIPPPP